jgi:plastocyanin
MRTLLTCLLAVLVPLSIAACGGGHKKGGSAKAVTFAKTDTVAITGSEYRFKPGNVVVTGGGGAIKFDFKNGGTSAHNLTIQQGAQTVAASDTFAGGRSQTFTAKLAPGTYTLICTVGDHASLGMTGTLTVK